MTIRHLARVSATGLLAAGIIATAAAPALAADVDFGVKLKGTTLALGSGGKGATLSLTNNGAGTPARVGLRFDARKLNDKIWLNLGTGRFDCTEKDGISDCTVVPRYVPGPGETADLEVALPLNDGATPGSAGELTVTVIVEGDTVTSNDTVTSEVVVSGESGPDLGVVASDLSKLEDDVFLTGEPLQPGERSIAYAQLSNQGDQAATNLRVTVDLPKHVTFATEAEDCTYNAAKTRAVCEGGSEFVVERYSLFVLSMDVVVSEQAEGPSPLTGGSWTAVGTAAPAAKRSVRGPAELPSFARAGRADEVGATDVDPSDNADSFVALLAAPAGGSAGGGPTGGDTDVPTLPLTGPVAASAAGAGALALAVGAFLFLSARRRRVSFAAPGDSE